MTIDDLLLRAVLIRSMLVAALALNNLWERIRIEFII